MLDREQVEILFFPGDKNGRRKAQRVLSRLHERDTLKRGRRAGLPCYYTVDHYRQVEHRIGVNWAYCYLVKRLKTWEELAWEYEATFGSIRADALATITNKVKGSRRHVIIEYDRGTEGDLSVVEKYADIEGASLLVVADDAKRAVELGRVRLAVPVTVLTVRQIQEVMGSA